MAQSVAAPPNSRKVAILGHYGFGNLGDDGVVAIVLSKIRDYFPGAAVYGISLNPKDTEQRHGLPSFPIRRASMWPASFEDGARPVSLTLRLKERIKQTPALHGLLRRLLRPATLLNTLVREVAFLKRSFAFLRDIDLLVVSGSGQLNDFWGGPWRHPYTLFSWALMARLRGVTVLVLSIGAGQLGTRLGKFFCRWFLESTDYYSFRDQPSKEFMERVGLRGQNPVYPDQGFGLAEILKPSPDLESPACAVSCSSRLTVGLNPVGNEHYIPRGSDTSTHRSYVDAVTAFTRWLLEQGYRLNFCPSDPPHDRPVLEEVREGLGELGKEAARQGRLIDDRVESVEDLVQRLRASDLVVASRFHGVVFPAMLGRPVLAISYSRKTTDLMNDLGVGEYALDIWNLRVEDLVEKFKKLESQRQAVAARLRPRVLEYQRALAEQYEQVFSRYRDVSFQSSALPLAALRGEVRTPSCES